MMLIIDCIILTPHQTARPLIKTRSDKTPQNPHFSYVSTNGNQPNKGHACTSPRPVLNIRYRVVKCNTILCFYLCLVLPLEGALSVPSSVTQPPGQVLHLLGLLFVQLVKAVGQLLLMFGHDLFYLLLRGRLLQLGLEVLGHLPGQQGTLFILECKGRMDMEKGMEILNCWD